MLLFIRNLSIFLLFFCSLCSVQTQAQVINQSPTINTVAGDGTNTYAGDSGQATAAGVGWPYRVVTDSHNNFYILQPNNYVIRKVDISTGVISSYIGNGTSGYPNKPNFGAAASGQSIDYVLGLGVDNNDNIYYGDTDLHYVGKIDSSGVVTQLLDLVAYYNSIGVAYNYPKPWAIACYNNIVYIADQGNSCVLKVQNGTTTVFAGTVGTGGYTGDGGPATSATLDEINGIDFDSLGNLYITDGYYKRIRKVDVNTGIITTWAGADPQLLPVIEGNKADITLTEETQIAFDANDNAYIIDADFAYVRKIDTNGQVTIFAGTGTGGYSGDGGPANSAQIADPSSGFFGSGIWVDKLTNGVFIADEGNHRVREVGGGLIKSITFEQPVGQFAGNANGPIDMNPATHGGGVRIFPDAGGGASLAKRELWVTIETTAVNIPVYIDSYDVDDSSQLFSTSIGNDNQNFFARPVDIVPGNGGFKLTDPSNVTTGPIQVMTGQDKKAHVKFIVTMQPGDNFKLVAAIDLNLFNGGHLVVQGQSIRDTNKNQTITQTSNQSLDVSLASDLLTVWRKVFVEVDSMPQPPDPEDPSSILNPYHNFRKGTIIGITPDSTNNVATRLTLELIPSNTLRDSSPDLDRAAPFFGEGRFEYGVIAICPDSATCQGGVVLGGLQGNGINYVQNNQGIPIPFTLVNSSQQNPLVGNVIGLDPIVQTFTINRNVANALMYSGGTITVGGINFVVVSILNGSVVKVAGPASLPIKLVDDDLAAPPYLSYPQNVGEDMQGSTYFELMQTSSDNNRNIFAAAYVKPIYLMTNIRTPVSFKNNVPGLTNDIARAQLGEGRDAVDTPDRWRVYLQGAFQEDTQRDVDPDREIQAITVGPNIFFGAALGLTPDYDYRGSLIFIEALRDAGIVAVLNGSPGLNQFTLTKVTIPHEIGHQFGLPDRNGLPSQDGIMRQNNFDAQYLFFRDLDLKLIRRRLKP